MKNLERIAKLCSTFNNQILQEAGQWRHSVEVWQKHCTVFTISLPTIWDYPILNDQTFASVLAWFHTACVVTWGDNLRLSYSKWSHVCICACLISYCMCQWCGWPGVVFFFWITVLMIRASIAMLLPILSRCIPTQGFPESGQMQWCCKAAGSCWNSLENSSGAVSGRWWQCQINPMHFWAESQFSTGGQCKPTPTTQVCMCLGLETYQDAKRQNQRDWGTVA